jgi:hypothetical protein
MPRASSSARRRSETIRIPTCLQRWGGRKVILTSEGPETPAPKPRRDETLIGALVQAHRWRRRIESGQAKSITDLAERRSDGCLRLPAPAAHLHRPRHGRGGPRWAAAEGAEVRRVAAEWAAGAGGAAAAMVWHGRYAPTCGSLRPAGLLVADLRSGLWCRSSTPATAGATSVIWEARSS